MSNTYLRLLEGNRRFVEEMNRTNLDFFAESSSGQNPEYCWIGCSDSRVPANQITGTHLGEIFVTRNIANLVNHTDMSMLSVLDYSINVLKVRHVIVCGHYDCGGVRAAMSNRQYGLIDNWLRHLKDVYFENNEELEAIKEPVARERRFVELNVVAQAHNVCKTSIVQNAWQKGEFPHVHGWVYDLRDGCLKNLGMDFRAYSSHDKNAIYKFLHE